ncbi:MAG TPA: sulfite exporter TauE/SafE family protein [Polyangia bacterium]|jgi:hypothetical protein
MIEVLGLVAFGFAVGFYGTLVGIGGGPLIIPMLVMFYDLSPATTVATSLSVVFLNACSGSCAYYQQRRIDLVSGTLFGVAAIPSSIAAYFLLAQVSHDGFNRLFGVFLLGLAGYVLCGPPPPQEGGFAEGRANGVLGPLSPRRLVDVEGNVYLYGIDERLGKLVNLAFGAGTTVLGIGGGILQVPLLVYGLKMPVHVATATAHYITGINTAFTLIPLLYYGHVDPRLTLCLGCGVVFGARVGARFSRRFSGRTLLKLLTFVFVLAGIRMLTSR